MELAALSGTLSPLTGLTPAWTAYYNAATGTSYLTSAPAISEQAGGMYAFNEDLSAQFCGLIDMGANTVGRYRLYVGDGRLAVVAAFSLATGAPLAGLSPTFYSLYNVNAGRAATGGETPSITAIGGGLYKFTPTTSLHMAGFVDFGATAYPRYVAVDVSGAGAAATTTTFWAIRDNISSLIEGLTPDFLAESEHKFREVLPGSKSVVEFALNAGSAGFRKFDVTRGNDDVAQPGLCDPSLIERKEQAIITVAYPALPGLYGSADLNDAEKVIRSDAHKIHDVVFSPSYYLGGQNAAFVTILPLDTSDDRVWFQRLKVDLIYLESLSL